MSKFKTAFASLALTVMLPSMANASPVNIQDDATDNGTSVFSNGLGRAVDVEYLGDQSRVGAGVFGLEYGSDASGWTQFLTFCLQISERLTLPKEYERTTDTAYFTDQQDREAVGALFNNFLDTDLGLADATSAAAMQIILWEVVEDGAVNFDLQDGNFEVLTDAVRNRANGLWDMVIAGLNNEAFDNISFNVFVAEGTQDLIVETPLPGAVALLLSGLSGLSFASRKKKIA